MAGCAAGGGEAGQAPSPVGLPVALAACGAARAGPVACGLEADLGGVDAIEAVLARMEDLSDPDESKGVGA